MLDIVELEVILLLSLANIFLGTWLTYFLYRNRLKTTLFTWISEYIDQFLAEIQKKPEIVMSLVGPALKKLAKEYGVPEPGGRGGTLNLFGIKIPRELVELAAPFLGTAIKKTLPAAEHVFG